MIMKRREFTKDVYAQIVRRATNEDGHVVCEGCGYVLGKKPYHVDHTIPDALVIEKRKLTAADGKLLGVACCHAPKTKHDVANIAQAKRREALDRGFKAKTKHPIPKPPKPERTSTKLPITGMSEIARRFARQP